MARSASAGIPMDTQLWRLEVDFASGPVPSPTPPPATYEITLEVRSETYRTCLDDYPDIDQIGYSGPCSLAQVIKPDYSGLPSAEPIEVGLTWDRSGARNLLNFHRMPGVVPWGQPITNWGTVFDIGYNHDDRSLIDPVTFAPMREGTLGIFVLGVGGVVDLDNQSWVLTVTYAGSPETPTSTSTPTATETHTATSTSTSTPTATETSTDTPSSTTTPTATETSTVTPTSTPPSTVTETQTDVPPSTSTATETSTDTPTSTTTPTASETPSSTPSVTNSATPTPTAIFTSTTTPSPVTPIQLLKNRGFEGGNLNHWDLNDASNDEQVCGDAPDAEDGDCYFRFRGNESESSALRQFVDLGGLSFSAGDVIKFRIFYKSRNGNPDATATVRVTYANGETQQLSIQINQPLADYDKFIDSLALTQASVTEIRVRIANHTAQGRLFIDSLRLTLREP